MGIRPARAGHLWVMPSPSVSNAWLFFVSCLMHGFPVGETGCFSRIPLESILGWSGFQELQLETWECRGLTSGRGPRAAPVSRRIHGGQAEPGAHRFPLSKEPLGHFFQGSQHSVELWAVPPAMRWLKEQVGIPVAVGIPAEQLGIPVPT